LEQDHAEGITWDPTTSLYWDSFNVDPEVYNKTAEPFLERTHDFRLNKEELRLFKKNGFVVSERMGGESFAEIFYRIYSNDLPVFISADSILHAWHKSYDTMLWYMEERYLFKTLNEILGGMLEQIPSAHNRYGQGVLSDGLSDADYFLSVALSLLNGVAVETKLKQDERVKETLLALDRGAMQHIQLFGRTRKMDFSQFKVRGHYTKSEKLKRYFKAMMWCGRVDFRMAGETSGNSLRELGAAVVLHDLLQQGNGLYEKQQQFDRFIQMFVGKTDSMTFVQLNVLLSAQHLTDPTIIKQLKMLSSLQEAILNSEWGIQEIASHPFENVQASLPRSLTLLGQKFILDGWAFSKLVYDQVTWDGKKVARTAPSALDTAFSVFGNNAAVPLIVETIDQTENLMPYQHNLAAVRETIDRQKQGMWKENLYMNWLMLLRTLSKPTTNDRYPEVMRTKQWSYKNLNTQLASWTQLRHDTVLYAKQSYGSMITCEYPFGYVEPLPDFWAQFSAMVQTTADLIEQTPYPSDYERIKEYQLKFLNNFKLQTDTLKSIAQKELNQEALSVNETFFLRDVMEFSQNDYTGEKEYLGWYPGLFFLDRSYCEEWDALVADVHTNPPSNASQGFVLHQAVGNVHYMMVAFDNGDDKMVYAGPVLSHYQFEEPGLNRKTDEEWQEDLRNGDTPVHPSWTKEWLVPGENLSAASYEVD